MDGRNEKTRIATIGVMSNLPTLGMIHRSGDKTGSEISLRRIIPQLERLIGNHDSMAPKKIASDKKRQR